jgi:hypothetical protein
MISDAAKLLDAAEKTMADLNEKLLAKRVECLESRLNDFEKKLRSQNLQTQN